MGINRIPLIKHTLFGIAFLLMFSNQAHAQRLDVKYELEAQAIGTTNDVVPFWMRSNQFGSVPLSGVSAGFIGRAYKEYKKSNTKLFDWGFGFEGRANAGKGSNLQLIDAYAKVKLGVFQFKAGRTKDVMGLNGDTILSSGNFAVSGNAPGVPKLELSIPEYYRVPIFDGLFSVKGNFVHGWLGRTPILDSIAPAPKIIYYINDRNPKTYFHQKSLYIRLGKADWKLKLYGGFNHQVYWGNEQAAYGDNFKLSPAETFFYVVTGKAYGTKGVPTSKIGNQLGSIDLGAEYDFDAVKVMIYRQNFYDVGALSKLGNINDGLNGISVENRKYNDKTTGFAWKKVLFELFYSKDQAGYPWSTFTKSGDEDYYNNFYYVNGWSYKNMGLGNPLITARHDARSGQAIKKADYFINNRVIAVHTGLSGTVLNWDFMTKISYSWNYGTFGTSIYGNSTGKIRNPQTTNIFKPVEQFSFYLEGSKKLKNGYSAGFATALDQGQLLNNSLGLMLRLKKQFQ
ncbi:capsule assembly Wzi family protein [Pedobacter caeni]|uniref:Capsule assembly protein Wzi n=1 Tax=Pedobacter caeni TaxID=288992 RepID=A0A1M4ZCF9_9SPHI|nr:capsule assembly Wzi family protein [Pedobacter caeni]SHF15720.1 Capsule assembly protein Wzi [Pedobacter caeni]